MSFPTDPIDLVAEVALNADVTAAPSSWAWTSATTLFYTRDGGGVGIDRGRKDYGSLCDPWKLTALVDNRQGNWSTRNPSSPWYGQLRKGTPVRVRVRRAADISDAFGRTVSNGWGTADTGQSWTVSGTAADFSVTTAPFGHAEITATTTGSNRVAWVPAVSANNDIHCDVSAQTLPASGNHRIGVIPRLVDASNFYLFEILISSAGAVTLRINERIAGVQTVVASVASSIVLVAGTKYRLRCRNYGQTIQGKFWTTGGTEPTNWDLSITDASLTTGSNVGCYGRNETAVTTHTYRYDDFFADQAFTRFAGFMSSLPPRRDLSGKDLTAPIEAKGLLYRMGLGNSPTRSALRRTITAAAPNVYLPMEDGTNATMLASGLDGGTPLPVYGGRPSAGIAPPGGGAAVNLSTGTLIGPTGLSGATASSWEFVGVFSWSVFPTLSGTVDLYPIVHFQIPQQPANPQWSLILLNNYGGGGAGKWNFVTEYVDPTLGTVWTFSSLGVNLDLVLNTDYHVRMIVKQVGGDVYSELWVNGVQLDASTFGPTATLKLPTVWRFNVPFSDGTNKFSPATPTAVSHCAIFTPARSSDTTYLATNGYLGEQAHTRASRLCAEDGLPFYSAASVSQPMGPQGVKDTLALLRECEATDQAYLYEDIDFGLTYQSHTERENQTTALALNFATAGHVDEPFEPTDDDIGILNDIEVQREGGSSTRVVEDDPLVELSIPNAGRRDDSKIYSTATDDQTNQLAGWRLHLGTFPGYRYPNLSLNLAAGPSLIDTVLGADLAYRATVDNPPAENGPDDPSLIIEGYVETIANYDWDIQNNCSLQGPWEVSVLAATSGDTDPHLGWLDFDTLTLHTTVNTSATSWSVDASPLDTTTADDFPRQMLCEGELITVTACSGGSAPQTWTVTRSVNGVVKGHSAGAVISLAFPFVLAL